MKTSFWGSMGWEWSHTLRGEVINSNENLMLGRAGNVRSMYLSCLFRNNEAFEYEDVCLPLSHCKGLIESIEYIGCVKETVSV